MSTVDVLTAFCGLTSGIRWPPVDVLSNFPRFAGGTGGRGWVHGKAGAGFVIKPQIYNSSFSFLVIHSASFNPLACACFTHAAFCPLDTRM